MSSHRVKPERLGARLRRVIASVLGLALIGCGALTAMEPAVAAPTCAYELCDVALVNVNGSDYITSMTYRTDTKPGMKNPVGATVATSNRFFSIEGRDDGSVWIHDRDDNCLYAGSDSGGLAYVRPCRHSPDELWYFQNEDYANSYAIRKAFNADGGADDRCLDVRDGKTGGQSQLQVIPCKSTSSNWQKFSPVDTDAQRAATVQTAIQDRATRYASTQCEKAVIVSCSYWQKSADEPSLANAVPLLSPVHNYMQEPTTQKVTIGVIKSATVTFGFSQKFAIKVEAGVAGFAKTEWTAEQAWSVGKAWTDTTSLTQEVTLPIPANGYSWAAYAQLARKVTGQINFRVKDTGNSWQGDTTVVLPSNPSGGKASQILLCDNRSTQKACLDSSPYASSKTRSATADAAAPTGAGWLVTAEGKDHSCSGVAISDVWVLTSKHCETTERVRYTTLDGDAAAPMPVDRVVDAPTGDVRMLHLATPHALKTYAPVDLQYRPTAGDTAVGLTIGSPAHPRSTVSPLVVDSTTTDALGGGELIVTRAGTSPQLLEDSGGPLVVNGRVVGIAAVAQGTGDDARVSYASLRSSAATIAPEIIGAVEVSNGRVAVTLGKNLFASSSRVMIWADGAYVAETYSGTAYYSWKRRNRDGTVTIFASARPGSDVQVGVADGQPGWGASVGATRVQRSVLDGATPVISREGDGRLSVAVPDGLVAASRRVMIYVNGSYVGETYEGTAYYLSRSSSNGTTTVTSTSSFAPGDLVEVRLATGQPGWGADDYSVLTQRLL